MICRYFSGLLAIGDTIVSKLANREPHYCFTSRHISNKGSSGEPARNIGETLVACEKCGNKLFLEQNDNIHETF